jgi:hypothetical protein
MKTSNRREEVLMSKKSSIALLAIGIGALITFASPLPAEANHYGRSWYETRREAARREIHRDWREIQNDRSELRRDVDEYYRDRDALGRAYRRGASPAEIARLRGEVRQGEREIAQGRRELRNDYAELQRDMDRYGYYGYGNGYNGWYGDRSRWERDNSWWNWGSWNRYGYR